MIGSARRVTGRRHTGVATVVTESPPIMPCGRHVLLLALAVGLLRPDVAAAQPAPVADRPFLFSVSTPRSDTRQASVFIDTGVGERSFDLVQGEAPEHRIGLQASLGHRLTLMARLGVSDSRTGVQSSQQGELLYSVLHAPARQASLAIGLGVRHEAEGVNVVLGRVAAGRALGDWRVDGNALFEKPYAAVRDAVDLITTFGVARRIAPAVHVGVELIGEDLEGFWEADEAEGGARILVGPSIRLAPPSARWQVSVAGGPVFHATRSAIRSDAPRSLPDGGGRDGYAVRCGVLYGF
jgi:hypothetical protein